MIVATNPRYLLEPLLADLVKWDNSLSRAYGTRPTTEYVNAFDRVRERMLRASQELRATPYDEVRSLAPSFERHSNTMTGLRTQMWGMQAKGTTFGLGWDRVLDQAIVDVRYGLRLLGVEPSPLPVPDPQQPYPPQYPTPYPPQYPTPYPPQYPPNNPDPTWPNPTPYPGDGGQGA